MPRFQHDTPGPNPDMQCFIMEVKFFSVTFQHDTLGPTLFFDMQYLIVFFVVTFQHDTLGPTHYATLDHDQLHFPSMDSSHCPLSDQDDVVLFDVAILFITWVWLD